MSALALTGCAAGSAAPPEASDRTDEAASRITAISPSAGSLVGGEPVELEGRGFTDVDRVLFGGVEASAVSVVSDTVIRAVVPASAHFAAGSVGVGATTGSGGVVSSATDYEYSVVTPVDAQMRYAFAHWSDYNLHEWGVFEENDCGNFVNQTMVARGWEQAPDWFSDRATTGDFSLSWVRGNEMDDWYASNTGRATRLSIDQRDLVKIGDVVMFDWDPQAANGVDHTMLVSGVNAETGAISLVGHTVDAEYRDFDTAITVENPGGTAHFYSIA